MSKVTVFYLNSSKFLSTFFSIYLTKIPPAYYLFDFLDVITDFLDFLDLKNFCRPKKIFNSTQNLKKTPFWPSH